MSQRVLLAVTLNGAQRHFYVLRKDCSLYQHDVWNTTTNWNDDAMSVLQRGKSGDVIALRSPIGLATGNTFSITAFELYMLTRRLNAATNCAMTVTAHLTERDREMVGNVQRAKNAEAKKICDPQEKQKTT